MRQKRCYRLEFQIEGALSKEMTPDEYESFNKKVRALLNGNNGIKAESTLTIV